MSGYTKVSINGSEYAVNTFHMTVDVMQFLNGLKELDYRDGYAKPPYLGGPIPVNVYCGKVDIIVPEPEPI